MCEDIPWPFPFSPPINPVFSVQAISTISWQQYFSNICTVDSGYNQIQASILFRMVALVQISVIPWLIHKIPLCAKQQNLIPVPVSDLWLTSLQGTSIHHPAQPCLQNFSMAERKLEEVWEVLVHPITLELQGAPTGWPRFFKDQVCGEAKWFMPPVTTLPVAEVGGT